MRSKILLITFIILLLSYFSLIFADNTHKDTSDTKSREPVKEIKKESDVKLEKTTISEKSKESSDTASKDEAINLFKKLEEKHKTLKTVVGTFIQIKNQKIFLEEIKSEGIFYFKKPGKFRCDFLPPNEMINYLIDNTAYMYVPENKQVDKFTFNPEGSQIKQLNQMLLGFGVSLDDIDKVFNYETDNSLAENKNQTVIVLVPKEKDKSVGISRIHIWFEKDSLNPMKIINYEDSGDETTIILKDVKINKDISEDKFIPKFPKDVEIIEQN